MGWFIGTFDIVMYTLNLWYCDVHSDPSKQFCVMCIKMVLGIF